MAERTDWQPIETAPKDGTAIDLWCYWPESGEWRRTADAAWDFEAGDWRLGQFTAGQFLYPPKITHWMPRPAPPTQPHGGSP